MKLLLVRHAPAEDLGVNVRSDSERALTQVGIEKMKKGAFGLKKIVPQVQLIATSPYKRSFQTAEIIKSYYSDSQFQVWDNMACGASFQKLTQKLQTLKEEVVLIVGHEPDLGMILSEFCAGSGKSLSAPHFFSFKKGGVACLEFYDEINSGQAQLLWVLKPSYLRLIATAQEK